MTNETTASQPKSIWDDFSTTDAALHSGLFNECRAMVGTTTWLQDDALRRALLHFESRRAPAAQASATIHTDFCEECGGSGATLIGNGPDARDCKSCTPASATIQASLDEREQFEHFLRGEWKKNLMRGDDEIRPARFGFGGDGLPGATYWHRETERAWLAWQARATIQEPVMVAEPMEMAIPTAPVSAINEAERLFYYRGWREAMEAVKASQAAPMVADPAGVAPFDFHAHLARQAAWSRATFGPGARTLGVCDHIRKELLEIESDPLDLKEWIDVVILALDGAWRCGGTPDQIIDGITAKQTKNEGRVWPDWRTMDPNKAIEHDRSKDVAATVKAVPSEALDKKADRDAVYRKVLAMPDEMPCSVGPTICTIPPAGWHCTRAPGHEGPCAAWPVAAPLADKTGGGD